LDQHGGHGTTAAVEFGFDDGAFGCTVGIGLQVENFRLQADHFEQLVDIRFLGGGDFDIHHLATHRFDLDLVLQEVGADAVRLGVGFVDLVDGDNDRNLRGLGMMNRLDRLRHHAVIGSHNQNNNICDLGAARAHGGERRMAGRIDESNLGSRWRGDLIGADMLGDATGFARCHLGRSDSVEQRSLAVVDVAHHGDDRCTRHKLSRIVRDIKQPFFHIGLSHATDAVAHFFGDKLGGIGIDDVVDRCHLALLHQQADHVDSAFGHAVGEVLDADRFGYRDFAHQLFLRLG